MDELKRLSNAAKIYSAVAMSGGVDSSVAAALLLEKGHNVCGLTMVHFDGVESPDHNVVSDAKQVCDKLGIKHYVVDVKNEFKKNVIQNFIAEYMAGRTPNPCVKCNVSIKWGALFATALKIADFFATGHYARIEKNEQNRFVLRKASFENKDQSYVLWRLDQQQLSKSIFPLGELSKDAVRQKAADLGFDVANKSESQEICFINDDDYRRFLRDELGRQNIKISSGDILLPDGKVVGRHDGIPFYTIGQRKGLGVAFGKPMYVTKIDAKNNTITIGEKNGTLSKGFRAHSVNWIAFENVASVLDVIARIRYQDPGYPAKIIKAGESEPEVLFDEPREAVTPGQSAVFYDEDYVIGGGIIKEAIL